MANYHFILPVDMNMHISSFYGNRKDPLEIHHDVEKIHYGLDFACPVGSNVYASADGEVIWVGSSETYGNTIIIEHQGGYLTLSAHLSNINVKSGDRVFQGQKIGSSGNTGKRVKGPHLHFETIDGNERINNKPIKDTIKENNGRIGRDGYNHIGINGRIGRYNAFTGERLNDSGNQKNQNGIQQANKTQTNTKRHYTRETLSTKYYIWHTQGDDKVRSSHAELDGTIHSVDEDIFPGEDYNCRCWAEEI